MSEQVTINNRVKMYVIFCEKKDIIYAFVIFVLVFPDRLLDLTHLMKNFVVPVTILATFISTEFTSYRVHLSHATPADSEIVLI